MEEIPDRIGPQKIAYLEKQNQKLIEALEEIVSLKSTRTGEAGSIAQQALDEVNKNE